MDFAFSLDYFYFVMAVTITSLFMIIFGTWVRNRFQKGGLKFQFANKSKFRRKFFGFILFIISIFLLGFLSERLQSSLQNYFKVHIATSVVGICIIFGVAWLLYDWLIWKEHNN